MKKIKEKPAEAPEEKPKATTDITVEIWHKKVFHGWVPEKAAKKRITETKRVS